MDRNPIRKQQLSLGLGHPLLEPRLTRWMGGCGGCPGRIEHRCLERCPSGRPEVPLALPLQADSCTPEPTQCGGDMAQGNNYYGQTSNGVADESPNMLVYRKVRLFWKKWGSWLPGNFPGDASKDQLSGPGWVS